MKAVQIYGKNKDGSLGKYLMFIEGLLCVRDYSKGLGQQAVSLKSQ